MGLASFPGAGATGFLLPEQEDDLDAFLEEIDIANDIENPTRCEGHETNGMPLLDKLKGELRRYRERPAESVFLDTRRKEYRNPLGWWQDNKADFPIMSELARILLCIPATSAPSERIFSLASRVISKLRSSLDPENASQIVFVHGALDWFDQQTVIEIND